MGTVTINTDDEQDPQLRDGLKHVVEVLKDHDVDQVVIIDRRGRVTLRVTGPMAAAASEQAEPEPGTHLVKESADVPWGRIPGTLAGKIEVAPGAFDPLTQADLAEWGDGTLFDDESRG